MNDARPVLQTILARRSIRRYTGEAVSRDQIEAMLDAAMAAPSGNGVRPWVIVVVQDEGQRRRLSQVHRYARMVSEAPVAFAMCADPEDTQFWVDDCSAATENILLAAQAMGLGGVWIGIYQRQEYQEKVREILRLPSNLAVHCLIAVGHPDESKPPHGRYSPEAVYWDWCPLP
ncbi:MAG: nitroreductase family protein [Anaerolineae bacterium]|nr:nitroreductase family protein [Anaerolineae bacterium]